MKVRKLVRTLQTELSVLQHANRTCRLYGRRILRKPADPDFALLRLLPDSLPGCYIDVGANHGQSIEAIRLFKPRACVHSFEPNPHLAAELEKRYRGRAGIFVHPCALADSVQSTSMYIPVYKGFIYDGLASLSRESAAGWLSSRTLYGYSARHLEVREAACRTELLDSQGLDPVFIKIDVQGREYEVVLGGLTTIRRYEPVLMIEDLCDRPRLEALLSGLGYKQYLFNDSGFYRARSANVVNFILMTDQRAAALPAQRQLQLPVSGCTMEAAMAAVLEVRCPDCGARLRVDAETGMVLHHAAGERRPRGVDLDKSQQQLKSQEQERERRFQQSVEAEKKRDDLLARKFDQSLRRVRDNPGERKPLRDLDLD